MPRKWTEKDNNKFKQLYPCTPNAALEVIFGVNSANLRQRAYLLGIRKDNSVRCKAISVSRAQRVVNHDFFEDIDTEPKAYFLGLLWADGYTRKRNYRHEIGIELAYYDRYILERFANMFESDCKIYDRQRGIYKSSALSISSEKLFNDLHNLGIVPNKTVKNRMSPSLGTSLQRHFVRGLFDGDGCVSNSRKDYQVSVAGNSNTTEWLLETTRDLLLIGGGCYKKKKSNCYEWVLGGNLQVTKFANWIYNDADFFLDRKYNKFVSSGLLEGSL